jgi:hypothetical protein
VIQPSQAAAILERNFATLTGLVDDVASDAARWKPNPESWSILAVICHLGDEEREDFGRRLRLTLDDTAADWPAIALDTWVVERRYNERELGAELNALREARMESVVWLRHVPAASLALVHRHPRLGDVAGGDLLAAWVAHDFLHLRQLAGLRFQLAARDAAPYSVGYSGRARLP